MTSRRLHPTQPDSFAFSPENLAWARGQMGKFPDGRQASAIIPLLFRAQEQEGWLTRPAIEYVATLLGMPFIRALEVATFYFMFRLSPIGTVAHVEVCGTTPCMLCGSEDLIAVCKKRIAPKAHALSEDGRFSWEEVECLGACSNAPMIQIGKEYYEDLTAESFEALLDGLAAHADGKGEKPLPGSRKGRFASEPEGGLTSLKEHADFHERNASVALAAGASPEPRPIAGGVYGFPPIPAAIAERPEGAPSAPEPQPALAEGEAPAPESARPAAEPEPFDGPFGGGDDLTRIEGLDTRAERMLNALGIFYFRQIAGLSPENAAWLDQRLAGFRGAMAERDWVGQAKALAEEVKV
ncbi:MAG: NADH-quinone oxidoreductase subunit NuoE [Pseudomonadota bacterium]